MLNPVQLQALAAVVRTGSFAEAGKHLGYTSSAISQQVAALERSLGVRLVVREAQRVRSSPAAERLADRGRYALEVMASLEEDVRALARGQSGRFRIATSLDPAAGLLAPTLRRMRADWPNLDVIVHDCPHDLLLDRVRLGTVDLGLTYDYPAAPPDLPGELHRVVLSQERWQLVTPSAWVDPMPLSALASHRWVVGLDAGVGQRALASVCASAGFAPRVATATANQDVLFGLVSAGQGLGVVPAVPWRASPEVSLRPFAEEAATRRTVALHVRGRSDVTLNAALRTLRDVTVLG